MDYIRWPLTAAWLRSERDIKTWSAAMGTSLRVHSIGPVSRMNYLRRLYYGIPSIWE